jgi:uncharacterized protein YjiS (DUF1127 family)
MSAILSITAGLSDRLFYALTDLPSRAWRALSRFFRLRADRALLLELPDEMLRDIGLDRSEIVSVTSFFGTDLTRRRRG